MTGRMNVLVLNCGSSSLRFQLIEVDAATIETDSERRVARGMIERIGGQSVLTFEHDGQRLKKVQALRNQRAAIEAVTQWIASLGELCIHAVGHRVVHGGEQFVVSTLINDDVLRGIEDCVELAPLHNPANLQGIRAARELLGATTPQVAVFDTAFHAKMPEHAFLYGIPYSLYRRHKIRRYGFHGTSHRYVAWRYRCMRHLQAEQVNIISLHLGNGSSACAIKAGRSIDTSMGFTPLEGLVMGTRCGDMDPSIVEFLIQKEGLSPSDVDVMLNKQSGLLGISGLTGDMRDLLDEEARNADRRAHLAIEVFCHRIRKYVGAYFAEMGGADAVVFTGGIGQNAPDIRQRICVGLQAIGLELDPVLNRENAVQRCGAAASSNDPKNLPGSISTRDSRLAAYVIPTDEELLIARDTFRCVSGLPQPS